MAVFFWTHCRRWIGNRTQAFEWPWVTLNLDFKVTSWLGGPIDALDVLCAELTCDQFAIAKFLVMPLPGQTGSWTHYVRPSVRSFVTKLVWTRYFENENWHTWSAVQEVRGHGHARPKILAAWRRHHARPIPIKLPIRRVHIKKVPLIFFAVTFTNIDGFS